MPADTLLQNAEGRVRVPLRLLAGRATAVFEIPSHMTESTWQQMIDMLNALKPGYVEEDEQIVGSAPSALA